MALLETCEVLNTEIYIKGKVPIHIYVYTCKHT